MERIKDKDDELKEFVEEFNNLVDNKSELLDHLKGYLNIAKRGVK